MDVRTRARLILIGVGTLMLGYGLWGLYSGRIVSTWARVEYRPSVAYWITVVTLVGLGAVNVVLGAFGVPR